MVKVLVISKAYFSGEVREAGEVIDYPDDRWKARPPSWARLDPATAFGGKGDHDGDGFVGGSLPKADPPAKGKRGRKLKAETVEVPEAEPFADAPEPMTVAQAMEEIGEVQPDWLPPQPIED